MTSRDRFSRMPKMTSDKWRQLLLPPEITSHSNVGVTLLSAILVEPSLFSGAELLEVIERYKGDESAHLLTLMLLAVGENKYNKRRVHNNENRAV